VACFVHCPLSPNHPFCCVFTGLTGTGKSSVPQHERAHIQQLLAAYQAGSTEQPEVTTSHASSSGRGSKGVEDACEPEVWAGEAYEEDQVRGVVPSYMKFSKRLAKQPAQCAR
jgi:hypothetical protein